MNNNEPNKIVAALFKRFLKLKEVKMAVDYDYKSEAILKTELNDITREVGAVEVMSKNNILKLIRMQGSLRFMADHSFYIQFAKAADCLFKIPD